MGLVELSVVRQHCRIEDEDDDPMLPVYISAAEQIVVDYLNRRVYATATDLENAVGNGTAGRCPMLVNGAVISAILLLVGHLYEHREDVASAATAAQIPIGAYELLKPHRLFASTVDVTG